MRLLNFRPLLAFSLLVFVAGCAVKTQSLEEFSFQVPESWESANSTEKITFGWLNEFDDKILNNYVRKALQNNYNLQASAQRLNAAIASARVINADLFPELTAQIQRARRKTYVISSDGIATPQYSTQYQSNLGVSWEVDVWGKLGDRSRAAYLDVDVQRATFLSARLSLAANVAKSWFNVIEASLQLTLSKQQLNSLAQALDIVENNYRAGLISAVDVFSSRSDLERQNATLAQSQQTLEQTKRGFNILLAKYPRAELNINQAKLPADVTPTPVGLPSELLLRRPDILAARYHWSSQEYTRNATKKNRYPSLALTGELGARSTSLSRLLDSDDFFWSLLSGITQPIFNAGRLRALEENATAQARIALAEYANTVLIAFEEVENALAGEQFLLTRYQATKLAGELAKSAYELSLDQYSAGLIDYVNVLSTQRQYFSADSDKIRLYNALIQNRINLHLALGGDFFTPMNTNN